MEIWSTQYGVMNEVVAQSGVDVHDIAAIGITNQRETTILWEKATGRPIYNAIVWQCRRTAPLVDELLQQPGMADYIRENTGLMPDAYFSATKIKWILDNVPGARERAEAGEILFGTVDTWLVWKLTGGRVHVTDRTNASRTMLYNIRTLDWDDTLLKALDIPRCILPRVTDSSEVYGTTDLCGVQIPVAGIAGDQQAALFGQSCFRKGEAKNTYGTGCFLLMNTGDTICRSRNGLISTIAISLNGKVEYALEGSVFVGGAVIQWVRDGLRMIQESRDAEYYAQKVPDNGGIYIVPAFTGLGAPYWDMYARGAIVGHHPRHHPEPYHPRGRGVHCLPERRPRGCYGKGHRRAHHLAEGGRRCLPRPVPDAVPGRHPEQDRAAPGHPGNDCSGRCLSGGPCHRCVEGPGRDPQPVALQYDLCPADGRDRAHPSAGRLAQGCGPKLRLGRALIVFARLYGSRTKYFLIVYFLLTFCYKTLY